MSVAARMLAIGLAFAGAPSMAVAPADGAARFITGTLHLRHYRRADVDLNRDGRAETLVYATDADRCGSGGCNLFVLARAGGSWRVVSDVSIARPPVTLLPTTTHGWRDLSVFVAGGGIIPGHAVRLRFDGRRYPGNPTVPPAVPLSGKAGRVLIAR